MIAAKLDIISDAEIQENSIAALKDALGVTGISRFLEQFDYGAMEIYTQEKYLKEELEPTDAEIRAIFGY